MLAVREWAKKAGLRLHNYDGFLEIYEKLSGAKTDTFITHSEARFRDAGNLVCSREAFETHLLDCTMDIPSLDELEKIASTLPHFAEREFNTLLSMSTREISEFKDDKIKLLESLKNTLKLLAQKLSARSKANDIYGAYEISIESINDESTKQKIDSLFHGRVRILEKAENILSYEIATEIERLINNPDMPVKESLLDKIDCLTSLFYKSARSRNVYSLSDEFMLVTSPLQKKDDLIVPYSMLSGEEAQSGVLFDMESKDVHLHGNIPISEEAKEKLEEEISGKQM